MARPLGRAIGFLHHRLLRHGARVKALSAVDGHPVRVVANSAFFGICRCAAHLRGPHAVGLTKVLSVPWTYPILGLHGVWYSSSAI